MEQLKAWQRTAIRNAMANYRQQQEGYCISGKPVADLGNGVKAFSLLSPPMMSAASRRRVRLIVESMMQSKATGRDLALPPQARHPHVITVAITYNCQCDCLHCSAATYRRRTEAAGDALRYEELRSAITQAVDLGTTCVILSGGEPLLFERIYDLVESVDKTQSVCTIFSNGEFLREHTVERLKKAGLFGVFVSLDSPDPAEHDRNRQRPGLFDKAVRGPQRCREAGILTGISTFATKEKILSGELHRMMDLAKALDVLEVFVFDVTPTGRLSGHDECVLTDDETEHLRELRTYYAEKPDYPPIIQQTMFSSTAYPCVAGGCPAGMVQMHLRANGDVSPCDFTPCSFGNVRRSSLREIWQAITASNLYAEPSQRCRLASSKFRSKLLEVAPVS